VLRRRDGLARGFRRRRAASSLCEAWQNHERPEPNQLDLCSGASTARGRAAGDEIARVRVRVRGSYPMIGSHIHVPFDPLPYILISLAMFGTGLLIELGRAAGSNTHLFRDRRSRWPRAEDLVGSSPRPPVSQNSPAR
jgi:hypothetical protein